MPPTKDIETVQALPEVSVNLKMFADGFVIVNDLPPLLPLALFRDVMVAAFPCLVAIKKIVLVLMAALEVKVEVTYKCPTIPVPNKSRSSVPPEESVLSPVD